MSLQQAISQLRNYSDLKNSSTTFLQYLEAELKKEQYVDYLSDIQSYGIELHFRAIGQYFITRLEFSFQANKSITRTGALKTYVQHGSLPVKLTEIISYPFDVNGNIVKDDYGLSINEFPRYYLADFLLKLPEILPTINEPLQIK